MKLVVDGCLGIDLGELTGNRLVGLEFGGLYTDSKYIPTRKVVY